jgi:hypothetical protein
VGNILRRHGLPPAPKRKHTTTWRDFIRAQMDVLVGTAFFTVEVLTLKGLVTSYGQETHLPFLGSEGEFFYHTGY